MTDQELEARVARAVDNFMAGYGCCQSVVAAFADLYGMDDVMAKKIAAGFGGGVGRLRMMWSDRRQRPRGQIGLLQGSTGITGPVGGRERQSHLCRDIRSAGARARPLQLRGFPSHGRILQAASLCRQGGKCRPHLRQLSEEKKHVKKLVLTCSCFMFLYLITPSQRN